MSHQYPTNLPEIIPPTRAAELLELEPRLTEIAAEIVSQGDESLMVHLDAVTLANSFDPPTYASEQLKLHHLDTLHRYFSVLGTLVPI